ncbi:MAG: cytochrome P450 [Roseiflexaceae bacterium]
MKAAAVPAKRIAPGPRGNLLLGALPELGSDPLAFLERITRTYGDIVRYRLLHMQVHLLNHPDHIRHVLQEHQRNYTKELFDYDMLRWITGNGLVTSEGSFWLRQRRLAQPAFHRQRIAALGEQISAAAADLLERWDDLPEGQSVDVQDAMMRVTLRVVGEALFGTDVSQQADQVSAAFSTLTRNLMRRFQELGVLPPILPTKRDREFRAARAQLDRVVFQIIEQRRRSGEDRGDLLSLLMQARDQETGEQMDDRQLRDEVATLLLAGHETTATTLTWAFHLLGTNPAVEARLHAELDTVLGGRLPGMDDLPQLPYTRMVIDETMRLYPPVPTMSRKAVAEDMIGGYRIPANSAVIISPYTMQRHPAFWPEPERFDPERFSPERSAGRPRFAYFPFSGGPRQCIGNTFALAEAQIILAALAQHYRLRPTAGRRVESELMLTLRPRGGLPMLLERRVPTCAGSTGVVAYARSCS